MASSIASQLLLILIIHVNFQLTSPDPNITAPIVPICTNVPYKCTSEDNFDIVKDGQDSDYHPAFFNDCCHHCTVEKCSNSRHEEQEFVQTILPHMKPSLENRSHVFLEIGGNDGIWASNTIFLQKCLKWTGIMIEAHPRMFEHLLFNRPGITAVNAAICTKEQVIASNGSVYFSARASPGSSKVPANGTTEEHITVPCVTMQSIFDALNIDYIDFLSLDVEGAELDVLRSIDFTRFKVGALVVEELQQKGQETKNKEVHEFLTRIANMTTAHMTCISGGDICDSYWVHMPAMRDDYKVPNKLRPTIVSSRNLFTAHKCNGHDNQSTSIKHISFMKNHHDLLSLR